MNICNCQVLSHSFPQAFVSFLLLLLYLSYQTTHSTPAERIAEKQCRRRGASSGHKTKRGVEGEDPTAAGIERVFSLKGPREENNVRFCGFIGGGG